MYIILAFFSLHWQLSVFCQTFFLHRFGAHRQFTMSKGWQRFFHLCTYLTQGSSFLSPRGYAILHRMHHAYSDTDKDPHSPLNYSNVFTMMLATKKRYDAFAYHREEPEARFDGGFPSWPALDKLGQNWMMRVLWGGVYTSVYLLFAPSLWWFLLLPADFLTAGELFQNNHHEFSMSPRFAARWFEVDPTYYVIVVLDAVGVIKIATDQRAHYPLERKAPALAASDAE